MQKISILVLTIHHLRAELPIKALYDAGEQYDVCPTISKNSFDAK